MQVVLLAGGIESRLAEETVRIPEPMVEIGGRPIILHVMDIYDRWGYRDFIVACGYKSSVIKHFFYDYHLMANDFTVSLSDGQATLKPSRDLDWNVSVVNTGNTTKTGGRLLRLKDWLKNETFMVSYSDSVGNIDMCAALEFHKSHGGLATVVGVQPPARFGSLEMDGDRVVNFTHTIQSFQTWINSGFFIFEPGVLDYISGDHEALEQSPLENLTRDGELHAFKHRNFWHPMDTARDRNHLNTLCAQGMPPWLDFGNKSAE
ncbi:MAG: glucose-1-phosphate cytidylyltransferase [Stappiaceae bacterium]